MLARVGPHDNIVTLYDFGVEAGRQFLALEYLPGGDLRDDCQNPHYHAGQVPCRSSAGGPASCAGES